MSLEDSINITLETMYGVKVEEDRIIRYDSFDSFFQDFKTTDLSEDYIYLIMDEVREFPQDLYNYLNDDDIDELSSLRNIKYPVFQCFSGLSGLSSLSFLTAYNFKTKSTPKLKLLLN